MTKFAQNTEVNVGRSKEEIERILERYGADQFMYGWDSQSAMIGFRASNRMIRIVLPLPDKNSSEFAMTDSGRRRTSQATINDAYQQEVRRRWRALALVIKAKLEAVETGIADFEEEFLAYIVLPDNSTVGTYMAKQVQAAYEQGAMPKMLPGIGGTG